jgi:hypothetical protein
MQDLYASSSSAQLLFLSAQSLPFSCLVSYFLLINCQGIYSKKFPAAKKKQKTKNNYSLDFHLPKFNQPANEMIEAVLFSITIRILGKL